MKKDLVLKNVTRPLVISYSLLPLFLTLKF